MSQAVATATNAPADDRLNMLDAAMKRHRHQPDSLIEILHTAQELFGYLDPACLRYVGRCLRVPHCARLIEIVYGLERIGQLLDSPESHGTDVLARASRNRLHGVGMSEAPRGRLFHDYTVDQNGLLISVDLLIATGQNSIAMNRAVTQIAKAFVRQQRLTEGMLNRVEAGIRAFDPCLTCSTHAGQMPLVIELRAADGALLDTLS